MRTQFSNIEPTKPKRKHGIDAFLERAILKHGFKYDYSKVDYKNEKTKVCIVCPVHGEFYQRPEKHIFGQGCPKCGGKVERTTEMFIEEARAIHGDKYDYSKTVYEKSHGYVTIICPIHGEFKQTAKEHLNGQGCKTCGTIRRGLLKRLTQEKFIKKATEKYGDKFDYSEVRYHKSNEEVAIRCKKHGVFWQRPNDHLSPKRVYACPVCWKEHRGEGLRGDLFSFVKKANEVHNNFYDYSMVSYENNLEYINIICPIHGVFKQTPGNHLSGHGCPICGNHVSKAEDEICQFINSLGFEVKRRNRTILNGKELDIFIPSEKLAIEYDGLFWHTEEQGKDRAYHLEKTLGCEKEGVRLVHIFEDEWKKHKEVVLHKISEILNIHNSPIIDAKDCTINSITEKEAFDFLSVNSLNLNTEGNIRFGLFNNGKLVFVCLFEHKNEEWVLNEFCPPTNVCIKNGLEKVIKEFYDMILPSKLTYFADRRWENGEDLISLGFQQTSIKEPSSFWLVNGERISANGFETIQFNGSSYPKIYDCGSLVFEKRFVRIKHASTFLRTH